MFYNRYQGNFEYDSSCASRPTPTTWLPAWGRQIVPAVPLLRQRTWINCQQRVGSVGIETPSQDSFSWPTTHSFSLSYARRIPWNQVVEVAYVGTRGRDLLSRTNGNVMPYGVMSSGSFNGVDMSVPINRVAVANVATTARRSVRSTRCRPSHSMTSVAPATTTRCS